jgi:dihydrofolate synthase/folylpolyglutamate synthase
MDEQPSGSRMNYAEALAWIYGLQTRGIKLGLDRVRAFVDALGWSSGQIQFLHVTGTNGKGSVCAMLDSICRTAGIRTGLFTSPHLVTFRERILLNGEMASKDDIARELTRIRFVCESRRIHATFFEITTALAFEFFRRLEMDVVVLETGLGGRLDATNIIRPKVSVITSIGMDHMQYLGSSLREIATEKAGIIKPGVPVVTGPLPEEAAAAVASVARERGAPLIVVSAPESTVPVTLKGPHQRLNAAIALRALEAAGIIVPSEYLAEGLRRVNWPGRFQDTGKGFILDGAHNPDATARLVETWREIHGTSRTVVILGTVRDKDSAGICASLAAIAENFVVVPVPGPRGTPAEELLKIAEAWRPSRLCLSLDEAIATTPRGDVPTLITGSLFLMGQALVSLGLAEGEPEISAQ